MPLMTFLTLIAAVMMAGVATILIAFWAGLPLAALGFAGLTASLLVGLRQWV